jgi:hypothetical protein
VQASDPTRTPTPVTGNAQLLPSLDDLLPSVTEVPLTLSYAMEASSPLAELT